MDQNRPPTETEMSYPYLYGFAITVLTCLLDGQITADDARRQVAEMRRLETARSVSDGGEGTTP